MLEIRIHQFKNISYHFCGMILQYRKYFNADIETCGLTSSIVPSVKISTTHRWTLTSELESRKQITPDVAVELLTLWLEVA